MRKSTYLRILGLAAVAALLALPASAGGPLSVCDCDTPYLWPNAGTDIPWNPDQGGLAILTNAQATQAVADAFQAWEDVPSATVTYSQGVDLPFDVDVTNYAQFFFPGVADGLSPIVYDDDGLIFADIFGAGSGVLGFAGQDVLDPDNCAIVEGAAFLNGPSIGTLEGLLDLMVHEFGHYTNLAHTIINGQQFIGVGDTSGPEPNATFGFPPFPDGVEVIATMYPFLFGGVDQLTRTPNPDDVAILSTLYPEPNFFSSTGTISGSVLGSNGTSPITGVNVIARNVADPFFDAVSAISSDFTDDFSGCCPVTGVYEINGLTPGATYAVYVDEIEAGGFSTPPASPLPGPEDFYNGAGETGDSSDDPSVFSGVPVAAGSPSTGIDILFNGPDAGTPLPVGDDGFAQVFLPFEFCYSGQPYDSVFINANGNLTFGSQDTAFFSWVPSVVDHLDGPPRIAGVWTDLSPNLGGSVSFSSTPKTWTASWTDVPEFGGFGANSFDIKLRDNGKECRLTCDDGDSDSHGHPDSDHDSDSDSDSDRRNVRRFKRMDVLIDYGDMTLQGGLAGVSAGIFATNGLEPEVDLTSKGKIKLKKEAAAYEFFDDNLDNDLANTRDRYLVGRAFKDKFEENDSLWETALVRLPFNTVSTKRAFSAISPAGGDVDYFEFRKPLAAGDIFVAEIVRSQMDTIMGLYYCDDDGDSDSDSHHSSRHQQGDDCSLVAVNDDIVLGTNLLSKIQYLVAEGGNYLLAVSTFPDDDFSGDGNDDSTFGQGRYILDAFVTDQLDLTLGDDDTAEIPLGFSFPYQGGSYDSVFVNSNGNLTFGAGDTSFFFGVPELLNGPPRIAPFWNDLSPNNGGTIVATYGAGSATVAFDGVPVFPATGANSFSVTVDSTGGVQFDYGSATATDATIGVSEGNGASDPGETDLSAAGSLSAVGTTYEDFFGDFDLGGSAISFDP